MNQIKFILYFLLAFSIINFLSEALTNPQLTFDEGGQFWLSKGLYHFSPLHASFGTLTDLAHYNRSWNMDPLGFSFLGFVWLKVSHAIIWIRILPLIFSSIAIFYVYKTLILLDIDKKYAVFLSLFFFLSNSLLTYSFTFRAYSLEIAGVIISLHLVLNHCKNLSKPGFLIQLSIILNACVWSRYGFIIHIMALQIVMVYMAFLNGGLNSKLIKNYLIFIVIPLMINVVFLYYFQLKYHLNGGPVSMYQHDYTLLYNSFIKMAKLNFLSLRGIPFLILSLIFIVNYIRPYFKISQITSGIFIWMVSIHLLSIIFSTLGLYPWYIKGRWGLTLEFISLMSFFILIHFIQFIIIKKYTLSANKITIMLLIGLLFIFNYRTFSPFNNCIRFLEKYKNSKSHDAIISGYLTPQAKYHILFNESFSNISKSKSIKFEGIDTIDKLQKEGTWLMLSHSDSSFHTYFLNHYKFKYRLLFQEQNDRIFEVMK